MPTEETFAQSPPFPNDVPIAEIPVISYKALQSNSSSESEKLFDSCRVHGVSLLNLRGSEEGEMQTAPQQSTNTILFGTTPNCGVDVFREIVEKPGWKCDDESVTIGKGGGVVMILRDRLCKGKVRHQVPDERKTTRLMRLIEPEAIEAWS
ncbi:hypothetical protein BOTCAL_0432g00070 [Botryotinia calthae]|uniref:Uncharacterized protein n=1 Tax=Botryotinia calthae TaxID=38488 RepID=A0A4Y8CNW6_9HELO|nr:hypothetical protein BOTCAL_0432g00070 [Botryotinia calthae]